MWAGEPLALRDGHLDCRSGQESGCEADGPPHRFRQRGRGAGTRTFIPPVQSSRHEILGWEDLVRALGWREHD